MAETAIYPLLARLSRSALRTCFEVWVPLLAYLAVEPWYPLHTAGQAGQWHPNRCRSEFQNTF